MDTQQILIGAQETLTVRRLFGEPIQVDGATIIPVAALRGGGGGGAKGDDSEWRRVRRAGPPGRCLRGAQSDHSDGKETCLILSLAVR